MPEPWAALSVAHKQQDITLKQTAADTVSQGVICNIDSEHRDFHLASFH